METGTAIGLGALLLGGVYAYSRLKAKQQAPSGGKDPCDALTGDAKTACQALTTGQKVLQGISDTVGVHFGPALGVDDNPHRNDSADNQALNGKVTRSIPKPMIDELGEAPHNWWVVEPLRWFTAGDLQYANGCVPFGDHPGWSKCAPGTHDLRAFDHGAGAIVTGFGHNDLDEKITPVRPDCWSGVGDGRLGCDPLTFKVEGYDYYEQHFPLPAKPGFDRWWFKGEPKYFPACKTNDAWKTIDHRTGNVDAPPCFPVPTEVPAKQPTDSGGTGVRVTITDPTKQGYVLCGPAPGHWEKARANPANNCSPNAPMTAPAAKQFNFGGLDV